MVVPVDGTVAILDVELEPTQAKGWLRKQMIRDTYCIAYHNLKGALGSFNLLDRGVRRTWADLLRADQTQALALDRVRPVMDALGLTNRRTPAFWVAFDELLVEAGIGDALVAHHMGHTGERARVRFAVS